MDTYTVLKRKTLNIIDSDHFFRSVNNAIIMLDKKFVYLWKYEIFPHKNLIKYSSDSSALFIGSLLSSQ